jgi:hypothetical protein
MGPRAAAVLGLATLGLGAFVWFYEIRGEPGRLAAASQRRVFPGLREADVTSLSLAAPGADPVRLERSESGWRLVQPRVAPADEAVVATLLSALERMRSEGEQAGPLARYGLDADARVVVFRAGDDEHRLRLGRETPLGGEVYATLSPLSTSSTLSRKEEKEGEKEPDETDRPILRIASSDASAFERGSDELRDRRVLAFSPLSVERLSLSREGESGVPPDAAKPAGTDFAAALARSEAGWEIVAPARLPADAAAVERLLSDLALLRADSFVDDSDPEAELADAALARPRTRIVLEGDALERPLELVLAPASAGAEQDLLFARGRDGQRYRVRAALVAHLPARLFSLRAKQLARFDPADVRALQLDLGSGEMLRFERSQPGAAWSTSLGAPRADALEALIVRLSRLDAVDVIAETLGASERAALGLEPPQLRVRVFGASDSAQDAGEHGGEPPPLADLRLGVRKRGRIVSAAGGEGIHRLDAETDSALPASVAALAERLLEPGDDAADEAASRGGEVLPVGARAP